MRREAVLAGCTPGVMAPSGFCGTAESCMLSTPLSLGLFHFSSPSCSFYALGGAWLLWLGPINLMGKVLYCCHWRCCNSLAGEVLVNWPSLLLTLHGDTLSVESEGHLKARLVSPVVPVLTLGVMLRCRAQRNWMPWQMWICLTFF